MYLYVMLYQCSHTSSQLLAANYYGDECLDKNHGCHNETQEVFLATESRHVEYTAGAVLFAREILSGPG